MQKIDLSAYEKIAGKQAVGSRVKSDERKAMEALNIGEGVVVYKREWRLKSAPITIALSSKGRVFKSKMLADGSGWAIIRTG